MGGFQERRRRLDVVAPVLGVADSPVALRGSEVAQEIDAFQRAGMRPEVEEVAAQEAPGSCGGHVAVDSEDLVPGAPQALDETAADVAGGSGDRYSHAVPGAIRVPR